MIRNPHTLEISWWDGPERFQYVNRNVISQVQNEDLFKFVKLFAPSRIGLHIGGSKEKGKRSNWHLEEVPYAFVLNVDKNALPDVLARAERLPFHDETFGFIVSFHTFEHIRGEPLETLKEWLRVLIPHGLIAFSMPDRNYFQHNKDVAEDGRAAYYEMTPDELLSIVQKLDTEILLFNKRKNNFDFDIILKRNDT